MADDVYRNVRRLFIWHSTTIEIIIEVYKESLRLRILNDNKNYDLLNYRINFELKSTIRLQLNSLFRYNR